MGRRAAILGVLGALGVLVLTLWHGGPIVDAAKEKRVLTTSSPGLSALFSRATFTLQADDRLCATDVTFYSRTAAARYRMRFPRHPAPEVVIEAIGPGYRATARAERLPVQVETVVTTRFDPPGRTVDGRFCWLNRGPSPVQLVGTDEGRSLTPSITFRNREPLPDQDVELILFEGERRSLMDTAGTVVSRASALSGGLLPVWVLWPAAVLLALVPLLIAVAFGVSVARAERR